VQGGTQPLTLTSDDVATALGYSRVVVRRLARDGKIPPPIDSTLSVAWWRWSRAEIEAYASGHYLPGGSPRRPAPSPAGPPSGSDAPVERGLARPVLRGKFATDDVPPPSSVGQEPGRAARRPGSTLAGAKS
jgi:predicted DNA-binding transcriptional regulator AlpA